MAKRARISTGSLYSHYRSSDECFLDTFDLVCRRTAERMTAAAVDEAEPRRRLARAVETVFRAIAADPQTARFMLRAAPAAGPAFDSRLQASALQVGMALDSCLGDRGGLHLPPFLRGAAVAGLARIGRVRISGLGDEELGETAEEVAGWIASLCLPSTCSLERLLDSPVGRENGRRVAPAEPWATGREPLGDDRAMILAATLRLARDGYHQLSVPRICREAGVARRDFNRHFEGRKDCFIAAVEDRVAKGVAALVPRRPGSMTWCAAVYRALGALCIAIEGEPDGARVLLTEISAAGTEGIYSRDRQITEVTETLQGSPSKGRAPTELGIEASTAAAWFLLQQHVQDPDRGKAGLHPLLAFVMLAPALGGRAAMRVIQREIPRPSRVKKRNV